MQLLYIHAPPLTLRVGCLTAVAKQVLLRFSHTRTYLTGNGPALSFGFARNVYGTGGCYVFHTIYRCWRLGRAISAELVWVGRGNPIQTEWSGRFRELFSKPQKPSRGRVWALNGHFWTSRLLQWNQNKKKRETDNQFLLILSFSAAMPQFCCSKVDWIEDPGVPQTLLGRVRKNWSSVSQEIISWC